jgi:hypothetical protein
LKLTASLFICVGSFQDYEMLTTVFRDGG